MWWKKKTELEKLITSYDKDKDILVEFARSVEKPDLRHITASDIKHYCQSIVEPMASLYYRIKYLTAVNKFFKYHGVPFMLRTDEVLEITPNGAIVDAMKTVSKFNPTPRTERNKLIVRLKDKGWSFSEIAAEVGLRSKSNVYDIYWREKNRTGLSTV